VREVIPSGVPGRAASRTPSRITSTSGSESFMSTREQVFDYTRKLAEAGILQDLTQPAGRKARDSGSIYDSIMKELGEVKESLREIVEGSYSIASIDKMTREMLGRKSYRQLNPYSSYGL